MKLTGRSLTGLLFVCSSATAQPDWIEQLGETVLSNITIAGVEESAHTVTLIGQANSNFDISVLMKAIERAKLGAPHLQGIQRKGGTSHFVLRVQAQR